MEIIIDVSEEERQAVIMAIRELNRLSHIKYMSQAMIASLAHIKPTKVRHVLVALIAEKRICQYAATTNPRLQRFYYSVNSSHELDTESEPESDAEQQQLL